MSSGCTERISNARHRSRQREDKITQEERLRDPARTSSDEAKWRADDAAGATAAAEARAGSARAALRTCEEKRKRRPPVKKGKISV